MNCNYRLNNDRGWRHHVAAGFLAAFAGLFLAACAQVEPPDHQVSGEAPALSDPLRVSAEEFASYTQTPEAVLLDVRTAEEFAAGHIPGAVNLDVTKPDFARQLAQLDPDRMHLVYCRSGRRSQRACQMMEGAGFVRLIELAPGINGWRAAGLPVE